MQTLAGIGAVASQIDSGSAQPALAASKAKLNQAINNEISATVRPNADDASLITAAESIAARYVNDPASSALVATALLGVLIGRLVKLVDHSGLVLSKTLVKSAIGQMIVDFEKFSESSHNHVPGENVKHATWLQTEKPSAK